MSDDDRHTSQIDDAEYEEHIITSVTGDGDWWELHYGAIVVGVRKVDCAVPPAAGQTLRTYGRGFGFPIRGIAIDGHVCHYRTDLEMREQDALESVKHDMDTVNAFEGSGKAQLDAQLTSLPEVFQRRLMGFRERKADFWWRFGAYEMSCCVDAVKIASLCGTAEAVSAFRQLPWEVQQARIPDLFDGHSGNSFGFACALASLYLTDPERIVTTHGALCVLVGCNGYGCSYSLSAHDGKGTR